MKKTSLTLATIVLFCVVGCKSQDKSTPMNAADQRAAILTMQTETVNQLFAQRPTARPTVLQAPGYAVFSDVDLPVLKMGTAEGYGVVIDNTTKLPYYMKMAQTSNPSQLVLKNYRLVFVFRDRATMQRFITQGWSYGSEPGQANLDESATANAEIRVYQITHDGVILRTAVPMTRYWPDNELN